MYYRVLLTLMLVIGAFPNTCIASYDKLVLPGLDITVLDSKTNKPLYDARVWLFVLRHPGTQIHEVRVFNIRNRTTSQARNVRLQEAYVTEDDDISGFGWGVCVEAEGYRPMYDYITPDDVMKLKGIYRVSLNHGEQQESCAAKLDMDPGLWLDLLDK